MKLSPRDFWSLTPLEWRWLLDAASPQGAMSLDELRALASLYPDEGGVR